MLEVVLCLVVHYCRNTHLYYSSLLCLSVSDTLLLFLPHKGRMFVVGCSMGPLLHYWYFWLDKLYVGKALNTVGKKVLADQLIGSPIIGMWYFLGQRSLLVFVLI